RADLLRPRPPGPGARPLPQQPDHVRGTGPRQQGVACLHRVRGPLRAARRAGPAVPQGEVMARELVVIGASWGGVRALGTLLGALPSAFPPAIAVAQHRGADTPA